MTRDTLRLLEFDRLLERIAGFTHCPATAAASRAIVPFATRAECEARFGQVEEIRRLGRLGIALPLGPFDDVSEVLELLRPAGALLNPIDLALLMPLLRIGVAVCRQFAYRDDIPRLMAVAGQVTGYPEILEALEHSLDGEGGLLDSASPLLFEIRTRKRQLTARIRKRLEEIVRERQVAIFLQDDFITQRNGRWVIPVRMDSKGMVPGVVHDVSNSGETAFMEPLEIIGLVNELENLVAEEKGEQIRIIRELCDWIREEADGIGEEFRALVVLDLLNGIARFADLLQAETPQLAGDGGLAIREGRHPLLVLMAQEGQGRPVVPLDLDMGGEAEAAAARILVITGPNTGGKTIAIKTAGLLTLMAQAGLPVPAAATSVFPVVGSLLADIGDDQSLSESLSTFSAHVRKTAAILATADCHSLVLLDELGTGTDPVQGAALACAILRELQGKGCLVLATTHLVDIVAYVERTAGMVNGAMEFDQRSFTPLYRLTIGEPGQSHALEIARTWGLPASVIDYAQSLVGRLESEFHELLASLKSTRQRHADLVAGLERRERELAERERLVGERLADAERQRRESREKGLREARDLVGGARREMNAILEEARRERSKASREKLTVVEERLETALRELQPGPAFDPAALQAGDQVFVRTIGYDAQVVTIDARHDRLRVRAGNLELEVPLAGVEAPHGKASQPRRPAPRPSDEPETPRELNLLGCRVEEALARLDKFLDQLALAGGGEARIVHGKGTGALLRGVRAALAEHPLVLEFRSGEQYEGGDGVTVVTLR
jgi:DNA mismatch repair protein MutS2